SLMFLAMLPCHRFFYRRSSLLNESFSPEWIAGIALVLGSTFAVTLFPDRPVEYSHDLWWSFAVDAHAPRSLRALFGASVALAAFAFVRLLRPAPPDVTLPPAASH